MTNNVNAAKAASEAAKAQAELEAAAAEAAKRDNHEAMRTALIEKAEAYGAAGSEGDMSQTKVAFLFNQACRDRLMTEEDASKVYLAYAKGYNSARKAKGTLKIGDTDHAVHADGMNDAERGKGAEKTAISLFRSFGRPGVVAQGLDLYRAVRELREPIGADERAHGSLFNAFIAVNRAVSKAADESEKPDGEFVLSDAERETLILKAVTKEGSSKTDAQKLAALIVAVGKLIKTGKFDASLDDAYKTLGNVKVKTLATVARDTTIVTREEIGLAA